MEPQFVTGGRQHKHLNTEEEQNIPESVSLVARIRLLEELRSSGIHYTISLPVLLL
jgi:hypothetical protein